MRARENGLPCTCKLNLFGLYIRDVCVKWTQKKFARWAGRDRESETNGLVGFRLGCLRRPETRRGGLKCDAQEFVYSIDRVCGWRTPAIILRSSSLIYSVRMHRGCSPSKPAGSPGRLCVRASMCKILDAC